MTPTWRQSLDDNQILWVFFDKQDAHTNTLSIDVMQAFELLLDEVAARTSDYRGMIITSGKSNGFIAGADIDQFKLVESYEQAKPVIEKGQMIFNKLEALTIPTLALISGFCLGGGLELALACRYRIAEDDPQTRLGLPETKLGILPGWGGTLRLPRLVGAFSGLPLILSGRLLNAKQAKKIGLVDEALPKRLLQRAATQLILSAPEVHQPAFWQQLLSMRFCRPFFGYMLRKGVRKLASPTHYPAPFKVIDNFVKHGLDENSLPAAEAEGICRLLLTDTSRHLVRVFYLQEMLKNLGKQSALDLKYVHVIGAGTMGGDIAAWCAFKGYTVTLQDRESVAIAPAIGRAAKLYAKKYKGDKRAAKQALDRLIPDPEGHGIKHADVIIEAVFEDLTVKQPLFQRLEQEAKASAILATNTSSIPLEEIARVMQKPERLIGIHFFNPVAKMPLVEIVKSTQTAETVVAQATGFVGKLGKLPLPVQSKPGFLVNRVLMPYLMECVALLEEGFSGAEIDLAAKQFGMPLGPVALADRVGLDVCLSVAKNLTAHFGGTIPPKLFEMVEKGHLGVKSGQGFYTYDKQGRAEKMDAKLSKEDSLEITNRLILRMLNEAATCLREGVVDNAALLDAGMIFGTGFAPFRGGLIHYAKQIESTVLEDEFRYLQSHHGERYKMDPALKKILRDQEVVLH